MHSWESYFLPNPNDVNWKLHLLNENVFFREECSFLDTRGTAHLIRIPCTGFLIDTLLQNRIDA